MPSLPTPASKASAPGSKARGVVKNRIYDAIISLEKAAIDKIFCLATGMAF